MNPIGYSPYKDKSNFPRTWLHNKEEVIARREQFLSILMDQYRQSREGPPDCAVCGKPSLNWQGKPDWTKLYRCFQCDIWLCKTCCKEHMPDVIRP